MSLTLARGEVPVTVALRLFLSESWTGGKDIPLTLNFRLSRLPCHGGLRDSNALKGNSKHMRAICFSEWAPSGQAAAPPISVINARRFTAIPTKRIAHLRTARDCCVAGFRPGL